MRLLNIEDMNKAAKKISCPGCIDDAAGVYLQNFFDFYDDYNTKVIQQAEKYESVETKYAHLKNNLVSASYVYQKFINSQKAHTANNGGTKRVDHFKCTMDVNSVTTTGFATELKFQCISRSFFFRMERGIHM